MSHPILTAISKLQRRNHEVDVINLHKIIVTFKGPIDSCYQNGIWKVGVKLPDDYPNDPPIVVRFLNRIFHPNIDWETGHVCLDVIGLNWNPKTDLYHIFEYFLPQLLTCPNPSDPFNMRASTILTQSQEWYDQATRERIHTYASQSFIARTNFRLLFDD